MDEDPVADYAHNEQTKLRERRGWDRKMVDEMQE